MKLQLQLQLQPQISRIETLIGPGRLIFSNGPVPAVVLVGKPLSSACGIQLAAHHRCRQVSHNDIHTETGWDLSRPTWQRPIGGANLRNLRLQFSCESAVAIRKIRGCSRVCSLLRRAGRVRVRAEHAAVPRLGTEPRAAGHAVVNVDASVDGHDFVRHRPAHRAAESRGQLHACAFGSTGGSGGSAAASLTPAQGAAREW